MKKISLVVSTLFLLLLFVKLLSNYSDRFDEVEVACSKNDKPEAVNLVKGVDEGKISAVLKLHNYITNEVDAGFVAKFIKDKLDKGVPLPALYNLNKRVWQIPSSMIDSLQTANSGKNAKPSYYVERLEQTLKQMGVADDEFKNLNTETLPAVLNLKKDAKGEIIVNIKAKKEGSGFLGKLLGGGNIKCKDVVVRLSRQYLDSLNVSQRETLGWAKTDAEGKVVFSGLDPNFSYSVLPIKKGFEYGSSKGTYGGNLAEYTEDALSATFSFEQLEHRIRVFDASTLKHIKEDWTMIVRSPGEFKGILSMYVVIFFAAWWGLFLIGYLRKRPVDNVMVSIIMTLTGLCLLTMFSINDPLTDKLLGIDMAHGIIAGVVIIAILQNVDFKKLYQNRLSVSFDAPLDLLLWVFKPFKQKVSYLTAILSGRKYNAVYKTLALILVVALLPLFILDLLRLTALYAPLSRTFAKFSKGSGYLLFAIFLTMLLFTPLGVAVGGMRVNLNVGILFQPSEIAKYLIIFFMSAYFCVNANRIVQFSEVGNTGLFWAKVKMLGTVILGLGTLMVIYLKLGDMGPSLVLAFTFIFLYSLIKSKIELEGLPLGKQLQNILTCDFAMLIYGILSFALFLVIGSSIDSSIGSSIGSSKGSSIGGMGSFCFLWFVVWIVGGIIKKQIFETAIFFNFIVSAFIFGGSVLGSIGGLDSVAERLESRSEMCTNTWGTLPLDGAVADAGENTQVAEGLWALASGGMWGQGLGNGTPHFIPAFHTDMVLESLGEQTGFVGILVVILLLALLLRKSLLVGYRTSHPFVFYLCVGIAIVTAVQFVIISLGSTGMIPLTGVTVPFFSYGKVSMILNLVAFGVILSISTHNTLDAAKPESETAKLTNRNIGQYSYSVSLLSWAYSILVFFIAMVFYYYQVIDRDKTLIRPVYVNNSNGVPVVEYNPRIEQLYNKMYSGDIYDRNGLLLATSDKSKFSLKKSKNDTTHIACYNKIFAESKSKDGTAFVLDTLKRQRRYYPLGEHLSFILGDYNSSLFAFKDENSGYVAEWRHLPELKGYNNLLDDEGKPMPKVKLSSNSYRADKWHSATAMDTIYPQLYNYSKLLPYLKAGVNSDRVKDLNNRDESWLAIGKIEPQDIHLTIDAHLQTLLQLDLKKFVNDNFNKSMWLNKIRASVVVVDAKNGDLLASANYPLPDQERLKDELVEKNGILRLPTYRDAQKPARWKSYTDMDLGLNQAWAPGSTAKIMSAMAGLRKLGTEVADPKNKEYTYFVSASQKVGAEPTGNVNMEDALVKSSNCYFIHLVNKYELYNELSFIYRTVGAQMGKFRPYGLIYSDSVGIEKFYSAIGNYDTDKAVMKYRKYIANKEKSIMQDAIWQWAWGQGDLTATPLALARVASIVANNGVLTTTRYRLDEDVQKIEVIKKAEAKALSDIMVKEASTHIESCLIKSKKNIIGGKTGTANRHVTDKKGRKLVHSNDGLYICYVKDPTNKNNPIAIAVRIERGQSSTVAKKFTKEYVLKRLVDLQYINKD